MSIGERRARQKESLRQDILNTARQILLEERSNQLSMRRVAERIDHTPTTIYLHFKDKSDLLFNLCEEVHGKVAEIMQAVGAGIQDPVEWLRAAFRSYIEFGLSQTERYRIAFMTDIDANIDTTRFSQVGTMAHAAYDLILQWVDKAIKKEIRSTQYAET